MGTHPIFESDFDCLTDRKRREMGIKNLMKLIQDECPGAVKETVMKNYFGRKIALDASMCLYQFLIAVRQDGNQLTNEAGEGTSHLNGLFYRTIRLVKVTKEHVVECKRLLTCMGIPFVEAETEAEAQVKTQGLELNIKYDSSAPK